MLLPNQSHDDLQPLAGQNEGVQRYIEAMQMQRTTLVNAYRRLSKRLERADPLGWSADVSMSVLDMWTHEGVFDNEILSKPASPAVREVIPKQQPRHDRVRIGIATMPGREAGLERVLEILAPQADEIFVYLNGMTDVPESLPIRNNVRYFVGPDYGDRAKFLFLQDFNGYYLTCDDDIAYASYHVKSIIDGIERYGRRAVVGWHGSIFSPDFSEFYNAKHRRVLSFRFPRRDDTGAHLLGTGASGFHTSTINLRFEDFDYPNMADVFFALEAQEQEIPMVVLAHEGGVAVPLDVTAPSISEVSLGKVQGRSELNVAETATRLVREQGSWKIFDALKVFDREKLRVAIIGRTDKQRWKKGGILKSCHLTADSLRRFQAHVELEDIETGDPKGLHGFPAEIVMIYVGDPERPDFSSVEALVDHHAKQGRIVIINLSVNNVPLRYETVVEKMKLWDKKFPARVHMMIFTQSGMDIPELAPIRHMLIVTPKTMVYPGGRSVSFNRSNGVFLGDIAKLSDQDLIGGHINTWTEAIRDALPGVPIYAVRQYTPRYKVDVDVDEVWPFMTDNFQSRVSGVRVMVSPVKYATFEMVPLEVAALGVPVIYRSMPQSLTEYLGISGLQIDSPDELRDILPLVYNDPLIWDSQSRAGTLRAQSSELNNTSGHLFMTLTTIKNNALSIKEGSK